ncbi:hypothetical protein PPERSA_03253 [Pseudocohnilembus persalinus]|uniref:Uncharacterized protein n=1 Tax=Pseudocohnilembus persalinus TaxID=266149 RepID=A0A0V0QYN0_PSEPJ|nr:hypothetical protein PPERSA_03253 [Pseudocohnilembus persalinus]|eukprot:KRX07420.1 hypothetical protein PPERSA_03253 [Pseudocohnilembus persalinus]
MKDLLSNYIVKNSTTKYGMFSKPGKVISQKQEIQFQQVERQIKEQNKQSDSKKLGTNKEDEDQQNAKYLNKKRKELFNNFRVEFDDPKEIEIIQQQQKQGANIPQRIGFIPRSLAQKVIEQKQKHNNNKNSLNQNISGNNCNQQNNQEQQDNSNPQNLKLFMEQKQKERALNKIMTQSMEPFTKQTSRNYREELKIGRSQNTRLGPQQYDPNYNQTERKLAKSIQDFKKIQTTTQKTQQLLEEKKQKIQQKLQEQDFNANNQSTKKTNSTKKKKSAQNFQTPLKNQKNQKNFQNLDSLNPDNISLNTSAPNQNLQEKIEKNKKLLSQKKSLDKSQDSEEFSLYQTDKQFIHFTASPSSKLKKTFQSQKNQGKSFYNSFYNKSFYDKTDYDIRDESIVKKTIIGPQFHKRAGRVKQGSIYDSGQNVNENRFYLLTDTEFTNPRPKTMNYKIDKNLPREKREQSLQSKKVNVDFKYDIAENLSKKHCKVFKFEKYRPHQIIKNKATCLNQALNYYDFDAYQSQGSQVFKSYKCARSSSVNYDKQKGRDEPSYYDMAFNKPNYLCQGEFQTQRSNYLRSTSQNFYQTVQGPFTPKSPVKIQNEKQFSKTQFSFRKTSSTLNPQISPKRKVNGGIQFQENQNLQEQQNQNQQQEQFQQYQQKQSQQNLIPNLLNSQKNQNNQKFEEVDLELLPVKPRQTGIDLNDENDTDFFQMDFRDFMVEKNAKSSKNKDIYFKNMDQNKKQELYQVLQMRNKFIDKKFNELESEQVQAQKNQLEQMFNQNALY